MNLIYTGKQVNDGSKDMKFYDIKD